MPEFTPEIIQAEYDRLGYDLGWFFLMSHADRLHDAVTAIVGLNPGGSDAEEPEWSSKSGNGYYERPWAGSGTVDHPNQTQIKAWHRVLQLDPDRTLCGQFIPFRSAAAKSLKRPSETYEFARSLWRWVAKTSPARTYICMGNRVTWEIGKRILGATKVRSYDTGWGDRQIELWRAPDGRRVIGMPHPSRFLLFDRQDVEKSQIAERSLLAAFHDKD